MSGADEPGTAGLDILADDEAFDGEHLAEGALVLIADGAGALVSERVRQHAESCAACAACIAEQALAGSEVHVAFAGLAVAERARLLEQIPSKEMLAKQTPSTRMVAKQAKSARVQRHLAVAGRDNRTVSHGFGIDEPKQAEVAHATQAVEEPSSAKRRTGGGGWWIAAGLLVAAIASAPSLSGIARGISEVREALLVVVAVSVQAEQALRLASGRLEVLRTTASWTAAIAMVGVGLWIARRDPRRGMRAKAAAEATAATEVEGTR